MSENRVGSEQFDTKTYTNAQTTTAYAKGEIFAINAALNLMAFAIEEIGTAGQARATNFPGGNKAAVCIGSELVVLDKLITSPIAINANVYFDNAVDPNGVIGVAEATTSSVNIGIAEEAATTSDTTVLVSNFDSNGPIT